MIILILLLLIFSGSAYGQVEGYVWEKSDGSVVQTYYVAGSKDTLSDVISNLGEPAPSKIINAKGISLPSENMKYWKFNPVPIGDPIIVDVAKKAQDDNEKSQKDTRRKDLAIKMGLTESEYDEAKDLGVLR